MSGEIEGCWAHFGRSLGGFEDCPKLDVDLIVKDGCLKFPAICVSFRRPNPNESRVIDLIDHKIA